MIDRIDRLLKDWVGTVLEDTEVWLLPPRELADKRAVGLYLIDLLHTPPVHNSRRLALQISLRYLVTTWAEHPEDAHRMLGDLVFAAMEHTEFEVDLEPVPTELWSAFGLAPRPSFRLRLPLRRERPEPAIPRVRTPVEVKGTQKRPATSSR